MPDLVVPIVANEGVNPSQLLPIVLVTTTAPSPAVVSCISATIFQLLEEMEGDAIAAQSFNLALLDADQAAPSPMYIKFWDSKVVESVFLPGAVYPIADQPPTAFFSNAYDSCNFT